jgi:hypothetical protein
MAMLGKRWDTSQVGSGEFEVVTGMLPGDSPVFATHGHLLRIRFV